jgi:membrane protein YdbS with pleckstrin-like domain
MFDFNINKHLDSDEKLLLFFRPSRKAYLFQYILLALIIIAGVIFFVYNYYVKFLFIRVVLRTLSYAIFVYAIIMLVRLEYRIWSRRYGITNERVMYSRGIFYEKFHSAKYGFITDTALYQTFWDKIVNTGTININTAGTDDYEIKYRKILDPYKIKKMINDQIPDRTPAINPNEITPIEKEIVKKAKKQL